MNETQTDNSEAEKKDRHESVKRQSKSTDAITPRSDRTWGGRHKGY